MTSPFFVDPDMDFATRCVLSGVRHGMAETGEVLATIERIGDGDPESWLDEFGALGDRLAAVAERAQAEGHRHSAWNAALRSANYRFAATWWAPATSRASGTDALWRRHRDSWDAAVRSWPSPVEALTVDSDGALLPGWWFTSPSADEHASVVVLVQPLGTPVSDVCMTGLDGALARGRHVLVVDGPGQGAALRYQGVTLADPPYRWLHDTVEMARNRRGVDPDRVVLMGVGHGALFAAAAAARAPGPAALVVDPGPVDLGEDAAAAVEAATGARARSLAAWTTTEPTGAPSLEAAVEALGRHRLDEEVLASISCPTFVATAEDAWGFRGQHERFLAGLRCPHRHHVFRSDEGAGNDCGIGASQVHDAAVFDWLDVVDRPTGRTGD